MNACVAAALLRMMSFTGKTDDEMHPHAEDNNINITIHIQSSSRGGIGTEEVVVLIGIPFDSQREQARVV